MKDKKIYIVLTKSGTMLAKGIRTVTSFEYNHISLSLDKNLKEMYSFGRRKPKNPFIAGFVNENETGFYDVFSNVNCLVYELSVTKEKYDKLSSIIRCFDENKYNYKFNIAGLLLRAVNIRYEQKDKFFCAEFVSYALDKSGIYSLGKSYIEVRPEDFYNLPELRLIYKGNINKFKNSTNTNYNKVV